MSDGVRHGAGGTRPAPWPALAARHGAGGAQPHRGRLAALVTLTRPFTLVAPALGMVTTGVAAAGASDRWDTALLPRLATAALVAAALNSASNALNQVTDLESDRINKPDRPLPSGRLGTRQALALSACAYGVALAVAWALGPVTAAIVAAGAACTVAYSAPPLRLKRFGWVANGTIALARGLLLTLAGWSVVAAPTTADPWILGAVLAAFLLGATSTKDFSDVAGDAAEGVRTLPVRHGTRGTLARVRPWFVLPFLALAATAAFEALGGAPWVLVPAGLGLALWGDRIVAALARDPERVERGVENHPAWRHMYYMMLAFQLVVAVAFVVPG